MEALGMLYITSCLEAIWLGGQPVDGIASRQNGGAALPFSCGVRFFDGFAV